MKIDHGPNWRRLLRRPWLLRVRIRFYVAEYQAPMARALRRPQVTP